MPAGIRAFVIAMLLGAATPAGAAPTVKPGPFDQAFEQSFLFHSEVVGRDFLVRVFAPPNPAERKAAPVVYALDQGYDIAGPAVRTLGGVIRSPYVVEVGYDPRDFRFRMVDMLFEKDMFAGAETGGGGAKFEAFLLTELRPWIEAKYPVDPGRAVLMGHSAAAFFTARVMEHRPEAFAGYVIASPSFQYDPAMPGRLTQLTASRPTKVFLSAGGAESAAMIAGEKAAAKALGRPGSGFQVKDEVFDGLGHGASYLMLPLTAYPFLFPKGG